MIRILLLLAALLHQPLAVLAEDSPAAEEVYVVKDYRYEPGGSGGDPDTGHALCATRCNALSFDYQDYLMPGGWELIKISTNRDMRIPLNNPFMEGDCICTVDDYVVKVNNRNRPKSPENDTQRQ